MSCKRPALTHNRRTTAKIEAQNKEKIDINWAALDAQQRLDFPSFPPLLQLVLVRGPSKGRRRRPPKVKLEPVAAEETKEVGEEVLGEQRESGRKRRGGPEGEEEAPEGEEEAPEGKRKSSRKGKGKNEVVNM